MQTTMEALTRTMRFLSIDDKPKKLMTGGDAVFLAEGDQDLHTATSHIYLQYNVRSPPLKPNGPGWTRFICFSDTHGSTVGDVPDGDVLVHGGDLSLYGTALNVTVDWLKSLPHPKKIIIAGNHDDLLDTEMYKESRMRVDADQKDVEASKRMLTGRSARDANIRYLEYEARDVVSNGNLWKTYGSPGTPWFSAGAFQYHGRREAKRINDLIPHDTQILITHGPPRNILDVTRRGRHAGCSALSFRLFALPPSIPNIRPFYGEEMVWDFLEEEDNNNNSKPIRTGHERTPSTSHPQPQHLQSPPSTKHRHHSHRPPSISTPPANVSTAISKHTPPAPSNNNNNNDTNGNPGSTRWLPHVRLHVFGHIHEGRGAMIIRRSPPAYSHLRPHRHKDSKPNGDTHQQPDASPDANRRGPQKHHHRRHRKSEEPNNYNKPPLPNPTIETVFVNAAGRKQPIIVDLWWSPPS